MTGRTVAVLAFCWSLFQIYIASDIPFWLGQSLGNAVIFTSQEARQVHLAFGLVLAMLACSPAGPRHRVPVYDWGLAAVGAASCLYLLFLHEDIAGRAGLPTGLDLLVSSLGMVCLGIAVRRALGLPLLIVASVFIVYVFFGDRSFMPEAIQWKGASFSKASWHFWMQTEGVFGVALGVSASMIFLFVLFGALLEKAGAGHYFISLAFALMGHFRGGPAKAAVMASALSGLYSGSSIANVVTTGTFTIPLMKRTGFKPEKAGAIEVASSTNGQLTPPVMGAAAFLIAEFTGVSYPELVKHAFLPAVIAYIALVYIVHLEALKLEALKLEALKLEALKLEALQPEALQSGVRSLARPAPAARLARRASGVLFGFIAMAVLAGLLHYGSEWVGKALPGLTLYVAMLLFLAVYLWLLSIAARRPDLAVADLAVADLAVADLAVADLAVADLAPPGLAAVNRGAPAPPRPQDVAMTGLYFMLPVFILVWCILIGRLSPATSAFWATVSMIVIVLTQRPLKALMRGEKDPGRALRAGRDDFVAGMIAGARNMIGISVATGVAGIIVGTVSLTGAHQAIGEFVAVLSGGNLILMLVLVAAMSLVLGMGLPTTANYIVVSSLMAPVILSVGAQAGLIVPLVAIHLFVFYFGILADDTPPVGLAAFAAAAISGGDPVRTGVQGFVYDIRTALLPFLFIFNTELLLIDVSAPKAVFVFVVAALAMMLFAAATQGYFLSRNRVWETAALLLIAFTLLRPGFWLDRIQPPRDDHPGAAVAGLAGAVVADGSLRMVVRGPDFDNPGAMVEQTVVVGMGAAGEDGLARLAAGGLPVIPDGDRALLEEPFPGTPFFTAFQIFDFYTDTPVEIVRVQTPAARPPKEWFYIPCLLLLLVVVRSQRRRQTVPAF